MSLLESIAFLLPPPCTTRDVVCFRSEDATSFDGDEPAVMLIGQRGGPDPSASIYPYQYKFLAIPRDVAHPRALAPVLSTREARYLLRPRVVHSSVVRRAAARALTYSPGPVLRFLGEPVLVATRGSSLVVDALKAQAPGAKIGCFLGNEQNAGRTTVIGFVDGIARVVAKVITEREGQQRAVAEAALLRVLASEGHLPGTIPRLVNLLHFHLGSVVLTDAFTGSPCPMHINSALSGWLDGCVLSAVSKPALSTELADRVQASTANSIALASAVVRSRANLKDILVNRTLVHGDFTPWNVLMDKGQARVFDWEYGTVDGLPEWDAAYFMTQVGINHLGWDSAVLARKLDARVTSGSRFYQASTAYRAVLVLMLADLSARCWRRQAPREARLTEQACLLIADRLPNLAW